MHSRTFLLDLITRRTTDSSEYTILPAGKWGGIREATERSSKTPVPASAELTLHAVDKFFPSVKGAFALSLPSRCSFWPCPSVVFPSSLNSFPTSKAQLESRKNSNLILKDVFKIQKTYNILLILFFNASGKSGGISGRVRFWPVTTWLFALARSPSHLSLS